MERFKETSERMKLCFGCGRAYVGDAFDYKKCHYCHTPLIPGQDNLPSFRERTDAWLAMYPVGDSRGRPGG